MHNVSPMTSLGPKRFIFASDFDKTLSFNDSGAELAALIGLTDYDARVAALGSQYLVQQGGELAYLLLHDRRFSEVRKEHLVEAGMRVRLKANVALLSALMGKGLAGHQFEFFVISAAPQEVVEAALAGIVHKERIIGTQCLFDAKSGRIVGVDRVPAGFGKVMALTSLQQALHIGDERVIYVGDGESDVHVMLHLAQRNGFTIAVSDKQDVARIARRTVLSDDAIAPLVAVLEDICGYSQEAICRLFESFGLPIWGWAKMRTDVVTVGRGHSAPLDVSL